MKIVLYSIIFGVLFVGSVYAQDVGPDERADVLWEAVDSYTPPFYKGKALPSDQSTIRAVAISGSFNPRTTTYTWSRNGKNISRANGLNKSSFIFTHDILQNTENIGVGLSAGGNIANSSASAQISPGTPSLVLYEKRDGFVDYTKGYTSDFDLQFEGTTLRIEPFFFSVAKSIQNDLDILFSLESDIPEVQNTIEIPILRPKDSGSSMLLSEFKAKASDWQGATLRTRINF